MRDWNRILSGLVAVAYVVLASVFGGGELAFKTGMMVILPLACIWFSEAMGGFTGIAGTYAITQKSPAIFVCVLGWVLLLLPVFLTVIGHWLA